jgi:hypothetical protein
MEEEDVLIRTPQYFIFGKKKYDISGACAERMLIARARVEGMYKKTTNPETGGLESKYETIYDMTKELVDILVYFVQIDFRITRIWEWFRRKRLSRTKILKNTTYTEINELIEQGLEPVIRDKKKALERERKSSEAMMLLMDRLTPERLSKLLENSLLTADIKKTM